ncbi:MAG: efflux transporter outer membrane subunit [Sphingomonadaceae bacterium]|nr:efflux transporter outer membrane subunit [Sphingomonadaceae bacterium]
MRRAAALLAFAATLAGCEVGPNYVAPADHPPPAFIETAPTGDPGDLASWWHVFGDPELDRLVEIALRQNLDVQTAVSRVKEARLGVTIARSQALPSLTAQGQAAHSDVKDTVHLNTAAIDHEIGQAFGRPLNLPSTLKLPDASENSYTAGLDASWQIDVFGGIRRSVEAARARTEAAQWSARDAQLTVVSEVADAYLQLRQYQAQEAVAAAEIQRQTRSLQILGETAKVGLVPQGDFARQRAQLATAQASLPPLIANERIQIHALGVLVAQTPESLSAELTPARPAPALPPTVPPGLPSELLRRRPDIRSAERNLAAATADIGVAVADLYPKFSITGALNWMSMAFGNIATITGRTGQAAGAVSFPILDWGRRRATVGQRKEEAQQSYLAYQQAVLGALRDVEDALARAATEQTRNAALRSGVADAERAVQAVDARYRTGVTGYTDVLDAQQQLLQLRDSLAASDGNLRRDLIALYRALGGGWDDAKLPAR